MPFALIPAGLALVMLLFPPWIAVGVMRTERRPAFDAYEANRILAGLDPDTGVVQVDTLRWRIAFAPIFRPPESIDEQDDAVVERLVADSRRQGTPISPSEILAELQAIQESAWRAARAPRALRRPTSDVDTVGSRVYNIKRRVGYEFTLDLSRLMVQLGVLIAGSILVRGILSWRLYHSHR